jgi:hypothetical protein
MDKVKNAKVLFATFLLFCVIVSAIVSIVVRPKLEGFQENLTAQAPDTFLKKKSAAYFENLKQFCLCSSANFDDATKYNILMFHPTIIDSYCSTYVDMSSNDDRCVNMYINNISVASNKGGCASLESGISASHENSLIRVLNNDYTLAKQCFFMNFTDSVNNTSNNIVIGLGNAKSLASMILLRPSMISIPQYGLYSITYIFDNTRNVFSKYSNDDNDNTVYALYLKQNDAISSALKINLSSSINPTQIMKPDNRSIRATVYSLNYVGRLTNLDTLATVPTNTNTIPAPSILNNIALCLDQHTLTTTVPYNFTFPINIDGNTSTAYKLCKQFALNFDVSKPDVFTVTIANNVSQGNNISFSIHPLFATKLNSIVKTGTLSSYTYHIIITYSMDLLVITGLIKEISSQKTYVYMTHNQVIDSIPVYLQYSNTDIKNTTIGVNQNYVGFSTIPNIANVAELLGYEL